MAQGRKAFHFDLGEERLKTLYPSDSPAGYKRAWAKIRAFMKKNGFTHAQYSGYESVRGMSYYEAYAVLENLQEKFPWFRSCAKAATLTEIGRRYDVLRHLAQTGAAQEPAPAQEEPGVSAGEETAREAVMEPPRKNEAE